MTDKGEVLNDDLRWIIAALSDRGMRLTEVIGLGVNDLFFDAEITFVRLAAHP